MDCQGAFVGARWNEHPNASKWDVVQNNGFTKSSRRCFVISETDIVFSPGDVASNAGEIPSLVGLGW